MLVKDKMKPMLIKSLAKMTFQAHDTDGNGDISLEEFIGAFAQILKQEKIQFKTGLSQ